MKITNKYELIPLGLFAVTAILSFIVGNIESGLGWSVATLLQIRLIFKF